MKFSTFHAFMLGDVKTVGGDHVMEGMKLGRTHHAAIRDEVSIVQRADELGYDGAWLREHHFTNYGFLPNTMQMASYLAGVTERIRIGSAVITAPLHNPIRVAEDIALADLLSGGRIDVGLGRGYQSVEFDAFGVPLSEARSRTDEAIEVMRKLWAGGEVTHVGRHWSFEKLTMQPLPVQSPPPVYYASVSRSSIEHYAAQGIPFIVDATVRTSTLRGLVRLWRETATANGHDVDGAELVAQREICLRGTDEEAREALADAPTVTSTSTAAAIRPVDKDGRIAEGYEYWAKGFHGRDADYYDHDPDWADRVLAGGPDRVVGQLRELEELGIANVICVFGRTGRTVTSADTADSMAAFAKEIMPELQARPT